jgi:hypothetical protein
MKRSVSCRCRPCSTLCAAADRLSYLTFWKQPPKCSNALTCASRNACCVAAHSGQWNAAPDAHARISKKFTFRRPHGKSTHDSPRSTSASTPGSWTCGTITSPTPYSSRLRRPT